MRFKVSGLTLCGSVSARDTVAVDTCARRATSESFAVDGVRGGVIEKKPALRPAFRHRDRSPDDRLCDFIVLSFCRWDGMQ